VQIGTLVEGTLSFFQTLFPTNDASAGVTAFIQGIGHVLDLHDIKDMRDDISHLTAMYLRLANALNNYHKLNQKVGTSMRDG
jgi:hypothetical protein